MDYAIGEWVQLNGDGWDPGVIVDWYIEGTGGSCKPGIFHSGTVMPNGEGVFCFQMYQGQSDDCGPYHVKARQYDDPYAAGDNFRIIGLQETITIGDYVWSDLDSNGIQDDGATGIADVVVTLQVWEQQGKIWDFAASTTTNGSGYYQFQVVPGNYRVVFPTGHAGYSGLTTPNAGGDTIDSDADQSTGATHDITLAGGQSDLSLDAGYVPEAFPEISVTKSPDQDQIPSTGGSVVFTVTVTNGPEVPVTLVSLIDDIFGDITTTTHPQVTATTCDLGPPDVELLPGGIYSCTFTANLAGAAGSSHTDTVTATAADEDQNPATAVASATVTFYDPAAPHISVTKTADPSSVPETGGLVTYSVGVFNDGNEVVTLASLIDDVFGDITTSGHDGIVSTTCSTGDAIAVGHTYSCSFTATVSGDFGGPDHVNTVTATAPEAEPASASASVGFTDVLPDVSITKVADPTEVPETGAIVGFTITVTNNSLEDVTIDSLFDSDFDLGAHCPDAVGTVLANGETYTCTFTELISGDASGPDHENTATVVASDDEGNEDTESATETVGFTDVAPTILVSKGAAPTSVPESGANVTYDVTVSNTCTEDLTLDSLTDSVFMDITTTGHDGIVSTDCATGGTILAGGSYSCDFTAFVSGAPSPPLHTNVVTAIASDNEGTPAEDDDFAEVTITNIPVDISVLKEANPTSVDETGGDVRFDVTVTNHNNEDVTLDSLTDDVFGDITTTAHPLVTATTCATGDTILANGGTYACYFNVEGLSGSASGPEPWHENEVTAVASDDDGGSDTATDIARVGFEDIPPEISIIKTADPETVPETGADVTFTVEVTNDGDVAITLTSLTDDQFGDLNGKGGCAVPQSLAPGAIYTCSFVENLTGTAGDSHINLATATGSDEDGNQVSVSDDAVVNFEDVLPSINVTKTPSFGALLEPGGNVTFTVVVTNDGLVDVTLLSLIDDVFGDLDGRGSCVVGILIEPGQQYTCSFVAAITGPAGTVHTNEVTATAEDNDENPAIADDDARVVIVEERPIIPVTGGGIKLDRASMLALLYGLGFWFLGLGLVIFGRPQLVRVRRRR
jgi:hypothetical protein